jgi:DNA segregation ATPase FtsK/SpoIIIE-like protein
MLIDLKGVELTSYNDLPHMLLRYALTNTKEIMNSLDWLRAETSRRYELFKGRFRKLDEYNAVAGEGERLPRILVVIDEASELMTDPVYGKTVEHTLGSLARVARAAGIHLIFATQNPVKTVITNEIQNNLNTKIAFAVGEHTHSQVIFKANGAETLLGRGDMIIKRGIHKRRAQCAYIDTLEIERITQFIKDNNTYEFDERFISSVLAYDKDKGAKEAEAEEARKAEEARAREKAHAQQMPLADLKITDDDAAAKTRRAESADTEAMALKHCVLEQRCSISWLQRKLSASFNTVAVVVERLEKMGYVGKQIAGQKNRAILITPEQYNELYPENAITQEEMASTNNE